MLEVLLKLFALGPRGVRNWAVKTPGLAHDLANARMNAPGLGFVRFMRALGLVPQYFKVFWNIYDSIVITSALAVTVVQILLVTKGSNNYTLSQLEKVGRTLAHTFGARRCLLLNEGRSAGLSMQALVLLVVLRLVQKLDGLQSLFKTIVYVPPVAWRK